MIQYRQPTRPNPAKQRTAKTTTLPAPTGGWYVGENVAAAPPQTAYILDNFFPKEDSVDLRPGSVEWSTGNGTGDVRHIFGYETGTAHQVFTSANNRIYEVTAGGAASSKVSGLTNNDWQFVQFTTTGGTFLRGVNGADTPLVYDGTTWGTSPAITGVTATSLIALCIYKARLYFVENNTLKAWYLPVDSIGGAATAIDLSGEFTLGGKLLFCQAWSFNTGTGIEEYCVFGTDQGEIAVYRGSYPGDVTTPWQKVGVYRIPKPLGRDCMMKAGGDLVLMTENGMIPVSQAIVLDSMALDNVAVSKNIAPEWRRTVATVGMSGWSIAVWPKESMALVVVPDSSSTTAMQYAVNAKTGAWCRFLGWDAVSAGVVNNELYYGTSDGRVFKAYQTGQDDETSISATMLWSFNDFRAGPARKELTAARLLYRTTKNVTNQLGALVDFDSTLPTPPSVGADTTGDAKWDIARWDVDVWPGDSELKSAWINIVGTGSTLAPLVQAVVDDISDPEMRVFQLDLVYKTGEALG